LRIEGRRVVSAADPLQPILILVSSLLYGSTPKMDMMRSTEYLVEFYRAIQRKSP
jgi:hypothetical protein